MDEDNLIETATYTTLDLFTMKYVNRSAVILAEILTGRKGHLMLQLFPQINKKIITSFPDSNNLLTVY